MNFQDRPVIVTGGAAGIGRAAAILCARAGAHVAILDIDRHGAQSTADELTRAGAPSAVGISCDVSSEADVQRAFSLVEKEFGPLYGLIANAGIDMGGMEDQLAIETWNRVISINLTGIFLTTKYALQSMLGGERGGSIVCLSSPAAFVAFAAGGAGAYSASKGGISAFVRCLAVDYARYGIRVNALVPGPTESTLMWANVPDADVAHMREVINSEIPLGRLAQPEEPARAAFWLLSDESSFVTGSHLVCDGGVLAKASISV
jgi:NAD(P)-dependent dehydrogenase (short-subunit alcohol dehydrogenase family)